MPYEFLEVQLNSALQSDAGQQHSIPSFPLGKPVEIAGETSPNDSVFASFKSTL